MLYGPSLESLKGCCRCAPVHDHNLHLVGTYIHVKGAPYTPKAKAQVSPPNDPT